VTKISNVFATGIEEIRKSWGWFLLFGILLTILGMVCVIKSQTATTFSILALGWVLAMSSVVWFVNSFYALSWPGFFLYLLNAIIRGVTGYLLISHPDAGAAGVTMVLAVLFFVGGMFRIAGASAIRFPYWGWTVFSGLASILLGVFLLTTWPAASAYFIGLAIGIDLILDGSSLAGFAGGLRNLLEA